MHTVFRSLDEGKAICWSGRTAWPILALVGTAVGIVMSIVSSGTRRNIVSSSTPPEDCYFREADDGDVNEDRISQLPDDLLSKILSRLWLREAARTSILARRWRNTWALRSRLTFNCLYMLGIVDPHEDCRLRVSFVNAVDQTLRLHSCQKITYAMIQCCFAGRCVSDIRRWMEFLMSSGAVKLDFRFKCRLRYADRHGKRILHDFFVFPFHLLFQAASLEHLQLVACALESSFNGRLESLKTLVLSQVRLDSADAPGILASCVNLQLLKMISCELPGNLCISGSCFHLKTLEIDSCVGVRVVDLEAVNLITFVCYSNTIVEYKLSGVPKLEQICISRTEGGIVPRMLGEVAECCPDLKTMLFQTFTDRLQYFPAQINAFNKLMQLELLMLVDYSVDFLSIIPILGACPVLEKFHLLARCSLQIGGGGYRWPTACYTHLKKIKFSCFSGSEKEIEFASFLVRSAPMLEELLLQPFYKYYLGNCSWFREDVTHIYKQKRRLIYEELSKQAVSSRVKVLFWGECAARTNYGGGFFPTFYEEN